MNIRVVLKLYNVVDVLYVKDPMLKELPLSCDKI